MINLDLYNKVYICGPITGMAGLNKDLFDKAEEVFKKMGKIVTNPHKLVPIELIEKYIDEPKRLWTEAMRICLPSVATQDAVFVLDGWNSSRGATVEIFTAQTLGIPVFYFKDMSEFDISFQLTKYPKGMI